MSNLGYHGRTRCELPEMNRTGLTFGSKRLTSQGKIPHEVELETHPEKSLEGRMWLMGDVSALIHVSRPYTV